MARMKLGIFLSSFFSGEGASLSPTSIGRAAPGTDATIGKMPTPAHRANGCFLSHPKGLGTNASYDAGTREREGPNFREFLFRN